jgi:CBS domain-containing protein
MRIHSILKTKGTFVATIDPSTTVCDASRRLVSNGVGALVVSKDGEHIDGILSERDVARALADHGSDIVDLTVDQLMTAEVMTCRDDDTIDHLMALMTEHRIRHVPVVDDGRLIGIVSIGDVVKHRLGELETETRTLHDYIETGR